MDSTPAADAQAWESRYRKGEQIPNAEPASFLCEVLPLLGIGTALDLAAGAGRNAIYLAAHGWRVVAVERSRAALEQAAEAAHTRGLAVRREKHGQAVTTPKRDGMLLIEADLEEARLTRAQFDLVICFSYLQRSLFAPMTETLCPGGILVYETYTSAGRPGAGRPRNPAHLLGPGELREAFPRLRTLFYREFSANRPMASLVARRPA